MEIRRHWKVWSDAEGWHYCKDVVDGGGLTCQYIFVMDALNFCFWPTPELEYDTQPNLRWYGELHWSRGCFLNTDSKLEWLVSADKQLPNVDERVLRLRGCEALSGEYDGLAINMVKAPRTMQASAMALRACAWFRDTSIYRGRLSLVQESADPRGRHLGRLW